MDTKYNVACNDESVFKLLKISEFINELQRNKGKHFLIKSRNCQVAIKETVASHTPVTAEKKSLFSRLFRGGDPILNKDYIAEYVRDNTDKDGKYAFEFRILYQRDAKCSVRKKEEPGYGMEQNTDYVYTFTKLDTKLEANRFFINKEDFRGVLIPDYGTPGYRLYEIIHQPTRGGKRKTTVFRRKKQNKQKYTKRRRN